ncbi:MAG TPA: FAD:protein FMN transferase [Gemmatimonadales bacterium]
MIVGACHVLGGALALGVAAASAPSPPGDVWVERQFYVMGTRLDIRVASSAGARGFEAIEAAFAEVRRIERLVSSWRDDSDIGRVNAAPAGEPVVVPAELVEVLAEVRTWSQATSGAFDPAVGALVDAWDLRGDGRHPSDDELRAALRHTGLRLIELDREGSTVTRRAADTWLDAGGFGKGQALRGVRRVLDSAGVSAAHVNFGGQAVAWGASPDGGAWDVPVAHPADRRRPVLALRLSDGSVATSGQSERPGHILDPRTGRPVPPWGSVTVVARDPLVADVLATALFVMGPDSARSWAESRDGVGVLLLVFRDGHIERFANHGLEPYLNH